MDGRDKSVYTNNTGLPYDDDEHLTITTFRNNKQQIKKLPYYYSNESYKYLGLWINLDLSWSDQTKASNAMFNKYIAFLYKKCFNATQTAEILNLVIYPAITYRMNLMKYSDKQISKWDKAAKNLMAYKLRENQYIGSAHWYLPNNQYGYNLFKLADLQKICLVSNFLSYGANFIDKYAKRSTKAIFGESMINDQTDAMLNKYKLRVVHNSAYDKDHQQSHPMNYFTNKTLLKNLVELGVDNVEDLIQENNKLISLQNLNALFNREWERRKYTHLKKQMCKNKSTKVKQHIIKRLERDIEWEFYPDNFYFDEENQGYEVYIDESLKKDKAGYGVYLRRKHQYNFYDRVDGEQTLQNATYHGILHVLKGFPTDEPLIMIIDRKAVINVMENFPTTYRNQQNSLHMDTLNQIQERLKQRTASIKFMHAYSHTNEGNHDADTLDKNLKKKGKMYTKYGELRTERYVAGNMAADKLADKGVEKEDVFSSPFNKHQNEYLVQSTRKKATKKNTFKGVINTRVRKTIKQIIRTDYAQAIIRKDKYETIQKYQTKTSKHSDFIIRSKMFTYEPEKNLMVKMLHGSLPTCEKMNRLVETEMYGNYSSSFYTEKYGRVTNEGYCPCCDDKPETIRHLFVECQNEQIQEIRDELQCKLLK